MDKELCAFGFQVALSLMRLVWEAKNQPSGTGRKIFNAYSRCLLILTEGINQNLLSLHNQCPCAILDKVNLLGQVVVVKSQVAQFDLDSEDLYDPYGIISLWSWNA